MILQCSACQARYLVPDNAIGASGRTVRCAKCSNSWFQAGNSDTTQTLTELKEVLDQINAKPKPIPPGSNLPTVPRGALPPGLIASVAAVASIAAAFLLLVIHPAIFGLPPSRGLALTDVGFTKLSADNKLAYEINGKVANTSDKPMRVPVLRITLVDKDNNTLQSWSFDGHGKIVAPGKDVPFDTGNLEVPAGKAGRFTVDLGNSLELALRRKPE